MKTSKKIIGYCGVDSGQLLIIDPCYLSKWKDGEFDMDNQDKQLNSYHNACVKTLSEEMAGEVNEGGVVTSTGYGDGEYPVVATYKEGRIQKIEIKFF